MRKIAQLLAAGVVAAAVPMAAQAVVTVTVSGTPYDFAAPSGPGVTVVDFNSGTVPAPFTLTGTNFAIQTGATSMGSAPATSATTFDTTPYLAVYASGNPRVNGSATLSNTSALYNFVSLYWGSIDNYNSIDLLLNGATIGTTMADYRVSAPPPAGGNQQSSATNARVNISSTLQFNGVRFNSTDTAFELDNVAFGVPEAATWMMMIAGFGMMGFAMRRRPRTAVTFG